MEVRKLTQHFAQLVYGYAGAGKTDYATSCIWDHDKQVFKRNGLWVTFGRETNSSVVMPVVKGEDVKQGKGGNLRLTAPNLDVVSFADNFLSCIKLVHRMNTQAQREGKPVPFQAIVVDGLSEFDMMFEQAFKAAKPDEYAASKYAVWNALLGNCIAAMQLLDPQELQAYVVITSRVSERKKGITNKQTGEVSGADPEFMPTRNVPAMNGQFRDMFPHYFSLVTYVETEVRARMEKGVQRKVPVHVYNMLSQSDDFLVKNQWERQWMAKGKPPRLENTTFDDVLAIIEEITKVG